MKKRFVQAGWVLVWLAVWMITAAPTITKRLIGQEDLDTGDATSTSTVLTSTGATMSIHKIPRYYDNNAFTDNLTLYGNDAILRGPLVDVRADASKGDGAADDNTTLQTSLNRAGVILVPYGYTFLASGTLSLKANTTLIVNGTLKLKNSSDRSLLTVDGSNVTITGTGTIDGNRANQSVPTFADTWAGHSAWSLIRGDSAYDNLYIGGGLKIINSTHSSISIQGGWRNVEIDGVLIKDSRGVGINLSYSGANEGPNRVRIHHCTFDNVGTGLVGPSEPTVKGWSSNIVTAFTDNVDISNNLFTNWPDRNGVKIQVSSNVRVANNIFQNGSSGVQVQTHTNTYSNIDISNNIFDTLRFSAIYVEPVGAVTINNVSISGNIVKNYCTQSTATGQASIPRVGIYMAGVNGGTIIGNSTKDGAYDTQAFITSVDNGVIVSSNTVDNAAGVGFYLDHQSQNMVFSSNITKQTADAGFKWSNGIYTVRDNANIKFIGNVAGSTTGIPARGFYVLGGTSSLFSEFLNNSSYGGKFDIVGNRYVARNNVAWANAAQAYNGTNNILSGNGYFDGTDDTAAWVPFVSNDSQGYQSPAYTASYTPDASLGQIVVVGTLTDNITINAPTNATRGQRLTFFLLQDGTGGRTVTWNSTYKGNWSDTGNTANKRSSVEYYYDGTNWRQVGGQMAWN